MNVSVNAYRIGILLVTTCNVVVTFVAETSMYSCIIQL